jgi:hypothetical protein
MPTPDTIRATIICIVISIRAKENNKRMADLSTTVRRCLKECSNNHDNNATTDTLASTELLTKSGRSDGSKKASYFVDCHYQPNHRGIRIVERIGESLAIN